MKPETYDFGLVRVLVADDHTYTRELITKVLSAFGFRTVRQARDGQEAFDMLCKHPTDVAVIDWLMEPVDGMELTRRIRYDETSPNPFLPIILLTAYTEVDRIKTARDMGVNEILAKPVSPKALIRRFVQVVNHPRQFIRCSGYFGPDRRRRADPFYKGPERRKTRRPVNPAVGAADDLMFIS